MVSKQEFEEAYNKFPPRKIEIFYFKYFSTQTLQENKWLGWIVALILFIPLLIGFIMTVCNSPIELIKIPGLIQAGMLVLFAIPWISIWYVHKFRIKKIRKSLGISKAEYQELVNKYYYLFSRLDIETYIKSKVR